VTAYFDSSVIVALYHQEQHSSEARRAVTAHATVPFTPLLDLEVRTVLRRMVGWKLLTSRESAALLSQLDDDLASGRLTRPPLDLFAICARAEVLSARHASRLLSRSLDTLHVAAALELGCTRFVTLDSRQARLADAAGLESDDLAPRKVSSRRG
jgi:predicted nucleic acid-binding protein